MGGAAGYGQACPRRRTMPNYARTTMRVFMVVKSLCKRMPSIVHSAPRWRNENTGSLGSRCSARDDDPGGVRLGYNAPAFNTE